MLHNTRLYHRDSSQSVNIPLPPDQHHCSDEAKWRLGGQHISKVTNRFKMSREMSCIGTQRRRLDAELMHWRHSMNSPRLVYESYQQYTQTSSLRLVHKVKHFSVNRFIRLENYYNNNSSNTTKLIWPT